jgi:phage I-like protein
VTDLIAESDTWCVPALERAAWARALKPRTLRRGSVCTLALTIGADGSLPTEFRLFTPGWNDTENGRFLFDSDAAASVMAHAEKWNVDLAIDLEHQMLSSVPAADPTARDARGWCRLELRPDGSLWAVGVTWTADGAARLSEKRQRYVSPAFEVDRETSRVTNVLNIAITAMPATHDTPALVAASARSSMDPDLIKQALDALVAGDAEASMEILKGLIASAAGAEEAAEEAPALAEMSADAPPADEQKAMVAASARLMRMTGETTLSAALSAVETFRASHLAHEADVAKLDAERTALEMVKRKENAIAFTKLGAETPHTTGLAKGALCKRLATEPIDEQNARLAALLAARGGKLPTEKHTPAVDNETHGLSAREIAKCKARKIPLEKYAALKRSQNGEV